MQIPYPFAMGFAMGSSADMIEELMATLSVDQKAKLGVILANKDEELAKKDEELAKKDEELAELKQAIRVLGCALSRPDRTLTCAAQFRTFGFRSQVG